VLNCGVLTDKVSEPGVHFHNPVGREIRQISTAQISVDLVQQKITDSTGNPILVSAVVTFRFTNPSASLLNVREPKTFVITQASATLKQVVGKYTYDELKHESSSITKEFVDSLQPRVNVAGATIYSVTLNELNYAPEIASSMLKKQTAQATLDARQLIVKGSVEIAFGAVEELEKRGLRMNDEEKFNLVSNLLVVSAGDKDAIPTLNVSHSH